MLQLEHLEKLFMYLPRLSNGFVLVAVMIMMLIMSAISLFTLEMNINSLKTLKYSHNMDILKNSRKEQ